MQTSLKQGCQSGFKKPRISRFLKNSKTSSKNTNDIQIWTAICGVQMAEYLLVGRNFVSGICKLKPKNQIFGGKYFCFFSNSGLK